MNIIKIGLLKTCIWKGYRLASSSISTGIGMKTICVSKKSSRNGSFGPAWPPRRVSNKCSSIFCGVPDITVYLWNSDTTSINTLHSSDQYNTKPIHKCTYLNAENPLCFATFSSTSTSLPCSCNLNVFASTSRRIRLKCSLSTRSRWQLFCVSIMVAALHHKLLIDLLFSV